MVLFPPYLREAEVRYFGIDFKGGWADKNSNKIGS